MIERLIVDRRTDGQIDGHGPPFYKSLPSELTKKVALMLVAIAFLRLSIVVSPGTFYPLVNPKDRSQMD